MVVDLKGLLDHASWFVYIYMCLRMGLELTPGLVIIQYLPCDWLILYLN